MWVRALLPIPALPCLKLGLQEPLLARAPPFQCLGRGAGAGTVSGAPSASKGPPSDPA